MPPINPNDIVQMNVRIKRGVKEKVQKDAKDNKKTNDIVVEAGLAEFFKKSPARRASLYKGGTYNLRRKKKVIV